MRELKDIRIHGQRLDVILANHAKSIKTDNKKGQRADLSGAHLRGANLSYANLRDVNLRGAYLNLADLRGANLSGADLRLTDLSGADLMKAHLCGTRLNRADLSGAKNILKAKALDTADFKDAKLDEEARQFLSKINITVR